MLLDIFFAQMVNVSQSGDRDGGPTFLTHSALGGALFLQFNWQSLGTVPAEGSHKPQTSLLLLFFRDKLQTHPWHCQFCCATRSATGTRRCSESAAPCWSCFKATFVKSPPKHSRDIFLDTASFEQNFLQEFRTAEAGCEAATVSIAQSMTGKCSNQK